MRTPLSISQTSVPRSCVFRALSVNHVWYLCDFYKYLGPQYILLGEIVQTEAWDQLSKMNLTQTPKGTEHEAFCHRSR